VRLIAGEAALSIVGGNYEAARQCHLEAIRLAERLDNETLLGELYSAAALTHLGVTKYESAVTYSDLAIVRLNAARAQSYVVHAVANGGLAAALLGVQPHVDRALTFGETLSRDVPMFLREDWLLSKADIYWALGRRSHALESAKQVVMAGGALPPRTITGKYARWLLRLWLDPQFRAEYESDIGTKLSTLMENITLFDAIDRVDIAVAATETSARNGGFVPDALREKVAWAVSQLSSGTVDHLRNLGVLT
jgi:hypothetical protein